MIRRLLLKFFFRANKKLLRDEKDLNVIRKVIQKGQRFAMFLNPIPKGIETKNISLGGRPCWHIKPDNFNGKTILMIHGGAFFMGLEHLFNTYGAYSKHLALSTKSEVYVIDYRLAPEHKFPSQIEDAFSAYLELLEKGVNPEDIVLTGDSAGAHLALGFMFMLKEKKKPLPAGVILLSPVTDLVGRNPSITERDSIDPMLPKELFTKREKTIVLKNLSEIKRPYASPIHGDYSNFPPMLLFVGGREILYDDTINLVNKAEKAGVDITLNISENMAHVYPVFSGVFHEGKEALIKMSDFINRVTSHKNVHESKLIRASH